MNMKVAKSETAREKKAKVFANEKASKEYWEKIEAGETHFTIEVDGEKIEFKIIGVPDRKFMVPQL